MPELRRAKGLAATPAGTNAAAKGFNAFAAAVRGGVRGTKGMHLIHFLLVLIHQLPTEPHPIAATMAASKTCTSPSLSSLSLSLCILQSDIA